MRILLSFKTVAAVAFMCSSFSSFAQNAANKDNNTTATPEVIGATWKNSLTPDGVYDKIPHESRILPWQPIREADVMWKKRVWREIDTRQKQNLAFRYPGDELSGGGMFIEILMNAIKTGKVQAFNEDNFTSTMTKDQLLEKLEGRMDTIPSVDPITQETTYVYRRKHPNAAAEKVKSGHKICRFAQPISDDGKAIMPSILEELLKARKDTRKLIPQQTDEFIKNVYFEKEEEIDAAIKLAIETNDRPVVIDFIVSRDAMVWPMVAAGLSNDEVQYARDAAPIWDGVE